MVLAAFEDGISSSWIFYFYVNKANHTFYPLYCLRKKYKLINKNIN